MTPPRSPVCGPAAVVSCANVIGSIDTLPTTYVRCRVPLERLYGLPVVVCHCCGQTIRLPDAKEPA